MNIVKKIIRICALYAKKRRLKKQLKLYKNTNVEYNFSKTILSEGANVTLNTKAKDLVKKVEEDVKLIVSETDFDCLKLLNYVTTNGTKVYRIFNAEKLLKNIGEEEGFISEKKGFDALFLSLITMNGVRLKTEPMFVFGKNKIDKYLVLYSFYKWYSMKSGLGGFEYETQKKYNKYLKNINKANIKNLSLEEVVGLQEAISRDTEATDFILNYEKETDVSKKVSKMITQDGGANI